MQPHRRHRIRNQGQDGRHGDARRWRGTGRDRRRRHGSGVVDRANAAGLVTVLATPARPMSFGWRGARRVDRRRDQQRPDRRAGHADKARELAPKAKIIASVREAENQHLLRQSGADSVVVSSETAGRLLGIATSTPNVVEIIEDLLTPDAGFAIAEREVEHKEVGGRSASARHRAGRGQGGHAGRRPGGGRAGTHGSACCTSAARATDRWVSGCRMCRCCRESVPTGPTTCAHGYRRRGCGWAMRR